MTTPLDDPAPSPGFPHRSSDAAAPADTAGPNESAPPPDREGRQRRKRRRRIAVLVLALSVGGGALVGIDGFLDSERVRRRVAAIASSHVGWPVTVAKLGWRPWTGIVAEDIAVGPGVDEARVAGLPLPSLGVGMAGVRIRELRVDVDWSSLPGDEIRVTEILTNGLHVRVPAGILLAGAPPPSVDPGPPMVAARIERQELPPEGGVATGRAEETETEVGTQTPPVVEPPPSDEGHREHAPPDATAESVAPPPVPQGSPVPAIGEGSPRTISPTPATSPTNDGPRTVRVGRTISIGRIVAEDARITLTDTEGARTLIEVEGGTADVPFTAPASREQREGNGRLSADRIRFGQTDEALAVEQPAAALKPTDSGFALSLESGELGGGTLEGSGELGFLQRGWPFQLDLRLDAAEPSRIAGAVGIEKGAISGDPLVGAVQLSGQLAAPQTWKGEFRLRTERLTIDPAAAASVGAASTVGEGRASGSDRAVRPAQVLDFRPARVEARLEGGLVRLTDALLHADGVALRGNGWVMLDGHLALAARLYLDESYAPGAARLLESLQPDRPPGLVAFPPTSLVYREFGVAGTLTEPEVYLWTDAPPLPVDRLLRSVRSWLGGGEGGPAGADGDAGASAEPDPEP